MQHNSYRRYLGAVFENADLGMNLFIVTRAIVLYKPGIGPWRVKARGFRHTLEQAQKIYDIFSTEERKIVPNCNILSGRNEEAKEARISFLKGYGVDNIYDLLLQYAEEEDQILLEENDRKKIQKTDQTSRNVMIGPVEIEKVHIKKSHGK